MIDSIKKILFTGSLNDEYLSDLVADLSEAIDEHKLELFSYSNSNNQNQLLNVKPLIKSNVCKMDLIVSIGGDGTMLKLSLIHI